jgi:hypothetical protein
MAADPSIAKSWPKLLFLPHGKGGYYTLHSWMLSATLPASIRLPLYLCYGSKKTVLALNSTYTIWAAGPEETLRNNSNLGSFPMELKLGGNTPSPQASSSTAPTFTCEYQ